MRANPDNSSSFGVTHVETSSTTAPDGTNWHVNALARYLSLRPLEVLRPGSPTGTVVIGGPHVSLTLLIVQVLMVAGAAAAAAAWLHSRASLRRERAMLKRFDNAPCARVLFPNPRDITPDAALPNVLVVRGSAVLVIDDGQGRSIEPVDSAELKMPVTAFTSVDDLAVAELLAFGAASIEGEFRHGTLLGVAVRTRAWQE